MIKYLLPVGGLLAMGLLACQSGNPTDNREETHIQLLKSPAKGLAGEPNLFVAEDGTAYLSWIAYENDSTDALYYASLSEEEWSVPRRIAAGSDWFVNWADFPSLAVYGGGRERLAAHWLAKSAGGTYDYDVHIAQSTDGGVTWSPSFIPHTDGVPAEHGFVTLLPLSEDRMMAVWLDGRRTVDTIGEHRGAMTLRTATFETDGRLYEEAELDARTCDCCQTDAALTSRGPIVVYRDRSEGEIRDIYYTRRLDGEWTEPRPVFSDHWEIAGCPVNGPAVAARDETVAVAWFSHAREAGPQVKVAFSGNAGASFAPPVRIDGGNPAGRVDVVLLEPQRALVSWLENRDEGAEIRAVEVDAAGRVGETMTLVTTSESRRSGFPILEKAGDRLLLAWTQIDGSGATSVQVGELRW